MIVAAMASIGPRAMSCKKAVSSILPQVDRLLVYLNGYQKDPTWTANEKVQFVHSRDVGWRGSEAKFYWSSHAKFRWASDYDMKCDAYFTCDDDIVYPPDYVDKMCAALDRHEGGPVGVHGARIRPPYNGYHSCLDLFARFENELREDAQAHVLGTGTMAYVPRYVDVSLAEMYIPNMSDLWFALQCRKQNRPLWAVRRKARWLTQIVNRGFSISALRSSGRDLCESELVRLHAPWDDLDAVERPPTCST